MTSQYEVDMYGHIKQIAEALNTLANCAQAEEKRRRDPDRPAWMDEALDRAAVMMAARTSVRRAFDDIETPKDPLDGMSFGDFNDLEGHAEWKLAVTRDETILGYTHWRTFKESDDRR